MRRCSQAGRREAVESLSITVTDLNPQPRIMRSNVKHSHRIGVSRTESLSGKGFLSLDWSGASAGLRRPAAH